MSKVICDVCGTAYPETSTQCPICGCVNNADTASIVMAGNADSAARSYTYVKGGRFSKANVKKRNRANQVAEKQTHTTGKSGAAKQKPAKKKKSNVGLVITAIVLLLAIIAVIICLALKLFGPSQPTNQDSSNPPVAVQPETTNAVIVCEDLTLDVSEISFTEAGAARMIYATPSPANTTDVISFTSSDESVATVTNNGKVEAVGPGEAVITVTCGDANVACVVICEFEDPTEETVQEVLEEVSVSAEDIWLNRKDITFSFQGEKWMLYSGDMDVNQLDWLSEDENVVSIRGGTAEAVGSGTVNVSVVYNAPVITSTKSIVVSVSEDADEDLLTVICVDDSGNEISASVVNGKAVFSDLDPTKSYNVKVSVECIIRCAFSNSEYQGVGGHGGASADGEG